MGDKQQNRRDHRQVFLGGRLKKSAVNQSIVIVAVSAPLA